MSPNKILQVVAQMYDQGREEQGSAVVSSARPSIGARRRAIAAAKRSQTKKIDIKIASRTCET
jgi:hypothetical protein